MERLTSDRPWEEAKEDLVSEPGYSFIWQRLNAIEKVLGKDYDLDRLKEIVEADREGRCLMLWAKPGAKVFEIVKTCSCGGYEEKFKYFPGLSDCEWCCEKCDFSLTVKERSLYSSSDLKTKPRGFGKTVFLAKEEAEAALRRMQDEGVH